MFPAADSLGFCSEFPCCPECLRGGDPDWHGTTKPEPASAVTPWVCLAIHSSLCLLCSGHSSAAGRPELTAM